MKKTFETRLKAIEWIAEYVKDEGAFEVLREQLEFNYIYTKTYFLDLGDRLPNVVLFDKEELS